MIRWSLAVLAFVGVAGGTVIGQNLPVRPEPVLIDVQPGERDEPEPAKLTIYKPKHMPARDTGQLVQGLLGKTATVQVESTSNTLLIRAAESQLKEVQAVLEALDQPPKQIAFEVIFVDLPATGNETQPEGEGEDSEAAWLKKVQALEGKSAGKSSKLRLTATENQKAMVQFGEQTPVATGVQARGFAPARPGQAPERTATFSQTATGTIVQATARVLEDGTIIAELDLERSRLAPESGAVLDESDDRGTLRTPGQLTTTCRTTVKLQPGEPRIISGLKTPSGHGAMFNLIVIKAELTSEK